MDRPFKCQECGKKFKRKEHLRDHIRVHTGERFFICDLCMKTFSTRGSLNRHKKNIHFKVHPSSIGK